MPYTIKKVGTGYKVTNKSTGRIVAKKTTKAKAMAQVRLLNAIDKKKKTKTKTKTKTKINLIKKKVKPIRKKYSY